MPAPNNISDDNNAMDYLRRLSDYRTKYGLSMRQLGKVIKRAPSTICSYEKFRCIPDAATYNALAEFLNWPHYCPLRNTVPLIHHTTYTIPTPDDNSTLPLGFTGDNDNTTQPDNDKKRRAYSIPENLLDDIRDIATIKGCSMSEIITRILEEYTAKHKGSLLAIRELRNS